MKNLSVRFKNWIWILAFTALAICLGCVFAACTKVQAESAGAPVTETEGFTQSDLEAASVADEAAEENYSRWLSSHYSTEIMTQEMWLTDLSEILKLPKPKNAGNSSIFENAYQNGIIDSGDEEPYPALTRRYAASTMVKALGYRARKVDCASDLTDRDTDMSTLVYYGYFLPDDAGQVYPDAPVTVDEYRALLTELNRFVLLRGKTVLSFGDSIMYGMGNDNEGIADLVAQKYGMRAVDYSASGATFGVSAGRSHIPAQIKSAAAKGVRPDLILFNGGTNDIESVDHGEIASGYDPKKINERTYAGGFEYALSLLQKYWPDTPSIYIRAHDMNRVDDAIEQRFGETAMTIVGKWRVPCADVYDSSDFCTEDPIIRDAYTDYRAKLGHGDGTHPTAYGYARFYMPLVIDEIVRLFDTQKTASA